MNGHHALPVNLDPLGRRTIRYRTSTLDNAYLRLEGAQTLVNRDKFDNRAPATHQELERHLDASEGTHDLLHHSQRNGTGHHRRAQRDIRH